LGGGNHASTLCRKRAEGLGRKVKAKQKKKEGGWGEKEDPRKNPGSYPTTGKKEQQKEKDSNKNGRRGVDETMAKKNVEKGLREEKKPQDSRRPR